MALVYPTLIGLGYNAVRRPKGSTSVQSHVSGREIRVGYWTYPQYEWDLTYNVLRDFQRNGATSPFTATVPSELKRLEGFFLAMQASLTGFYFEDPDDNAVVGQVLGVGDGVQQDFLVVRTYGDVGYGATVTEPVGNILGPSKVYLNGVLQTLNVDYTVGGVAGGTLISFIAPPGNTVVVTIDMSYAFCARFAQDSLDFEKFAGAPGVALWTVKKVTLMSLRGL